MNIQKPITCLLIALPLSAATHWVGSGSPAGYDAYYPATNSGLQSALNTAEYGDRIVIQTTTIPSVSVTLPPKPGNGWIDVQGEGLVNLPEGYRVGPSSTAYMPKLQALNGSAAITADVNAMSITVDAGTNKIHRTGHGLAEGTPILINAHRISPYACADVNSPISGDCTSARVDHLVHRLGTVNWADGTPIWLYGQMPPGGLMHDRWYYVRDSTTGRFKVAETAGGSAVDITLPEVRGTTAVAMPYPLTPDVIYYVRNPETNAFQLSRSASGAIIDLESSGISVTASPVNQRIRGWRFTGIEIEQASGNSRSFMLVYLGGGDAPRHETQQPSDFVFDRVYVHGQPWESGPTRSFYINARNVLITNSYIAENKDYASGQSQGIVILNSTGNITVENTYLSAQGESVMVGGATQSIIGAIPRNLVFRRNFFERPLEWYRGVLLARTSSTRLTAQVYSTATTCAAASSLAPSLQCFAYRPNNETPCVITQDSTVIPNGSITGSYGFGVRNDCTFTFIHTGSPGDWTCTGDIVCDDTGDSLDWTGIVNRIRSGNITSGIISSTATVYRLDMRNNFETKNGEKIFIEGNVFNGAWYDTGFDGHVTLNVQTASTNGELVAYWAQSSEHLIQNNLFKNGVAVVMGDATSSLGGRPEASNFRARGRNTLRNNLAYEIGSYKWGKSMSHVTSNRPMYWTAQDDLLIDHNTIADVDFYSEQMEEVGNYQIRRNNIVVPRSGSTTFPHVTHTSGGGSGWVTIANSKCLNCSWINQAILNTTGSSQASKYGNSFLISAGNSLTSYSFLNASSRNYRIVSGDFAAGGSNDGTDGRALGADQDEIEALTGILGADVEAGIPEFARRANLILTPGTTTATLTYTPETSAGCAIKVWDNSAYSGTPVVDTTDSGATLWFNRRANSLAGLTTATNYYGKLICGADGADGIAILRFRTR